MESVFSYQDYFEFLHALVKYREKQGKTQVELAITMGCQAAYFGQVLKQRANLTEDQVANLCQFLSFSDLETEYFLLLLRKVKAGTHTLRSHLESRCKEILTLQQEIETHLKSRKIKDSTSDRLKSYYCASWQASLIHLATSCKTLRTANAIAKRFKLDSNLVEYHLNQLREFDLVTLKGGDWIYNGGSIHFSKNSPQDIQFQLARRLLAMNSLGGDRGTSNLHYSVVFASNLETFKKLHNEFLQLVERIHTVVEPTDSDEVYTICLDLFKP